MQNLNLKKIFLLSLLLLFFDCKNYEKPCNRLEALIGVWESTLYIQEGGHSSTYPFKPGDNTEWYNYLVFSKDGKVYKAYKTINTLNGKSVLIKEQVFDVSFDGDVMTWIDKNESSKVHFLLKGDELTTVKKDQFDKQLIYRYKKVTSPTMDEIIKPKS